MKGLTILLSDVERGQLWLEIVSPSPNREVSLILLAFRFPKQFMDAPCISCNYMFSCFTGLSFSKEICWCTLHLHNCLVILFLGLPSVDREFGGIHNGKYCTQNIQTHCGGDCGHCKRHWIEVRMNDKITLWAVVSSRVLKVFDVFLCTQHNVSHIAKLVYILENVCWTSVDMAISWTEISTIFHFLQEPTSIDQTYVVCTFQSGQPLRSDAHTFGFRANWKEVSVSYYLILWVPECAI